MDDSFLDRATLPRSSVAIVPRATSTASISSVPDEILPEGAEICRRAIANLHEHRKERVPTQGDQFSMRLRDETFTDCTKAGRALIFAAAALKPFQTTKPIGNIGGFSIAIQKLEDRANIVIQGKNTYTAHISETPLGTISSLEHAITHLDQRLVERTADLADLERKQSDLAKHLDQPFEYFEQLEAATTRQAEIVATLDLTKNQAAATIDEGTDETVKTVQEIPQRVAGPRKYARV
jgi:Asp-tRNA(Asn)/Glu-tRNA(Gln) amidotransferase C subunit